MSTVEHPGVSRWGHRFGHRRVRESRERANRVVARAQQIEAQATARVDRVTTASTRVEKAAIELLEKRDTLYRVAARKAARKT